MIEIIGIISIFVGLLWLHKLTFKNKPIIFFKIIEKEIIFYVNTEGKYAISTVKGKYIKILDDFRIIINQKFKSNSNIKIKELNFRNKTYNKWHIGAEFLIFDITETGSYKLEIESIDSLVVKQQRFIGNIRIFDEIETNKIELAIEKYYPFYHRIISTVLIVFGLVVIILQNT